MLNKQNNLDKIASDEAYAIYDMYLSRCGKILNNQFKILSRVIKDNNNE